MARIVVEYFRFHFETDQSDVFHPCICHERTGSPIATDPLEEISFGRNSHSTDGHVRFIPMNPRPKVGTSQSLGADRVTTKSCPVGCAS